MSLKRGTDDGSSEQKTSPIPRNLSHQSVTLHFKNTTWEEIGRGELKYFPACQNPYYIMDSAMLEQFVRFKHLWSTMEIHDVNYKMSNLMMLQDDYRIEAGTPVDTTTFVQVCYLLEYCPTRNTEYFMLYDVTNKESLEGTPVTYDFALDTTNSQLIKLKGYNNFETLGIRPALINKNAGYEPSASPQYDPTKYSIMSPYIAPDAPGIIRECSANLQVSTAPADDYFVDFAQHPTFSRNLDKVTSFKYGDTLQRSIVTNLHDKQLVNLPNNDFTNRENYLDVIIDNKKVRFIKEWCYPSPNRPYYSRNTNLSGLTPLLNPKRLNNLRHHFISMPPIKKANDSLLGQRCSFMLESSFSVTFNFIESIFEDDEAQEFLHQKDAILLRPNIYGKLKKDIGSNSGAFCRSGTIPECTSTTICPINDSFAELFSFLSVIQESEFTMLFKTYNKLAEGTSVNAMVIGQLNGDTFTPPIQTVWKEYLDGSTDIVLEIKNPIRDATGTKYSTVLFGDSINYNELLSDGPLSSDNSLYLYIDMLGFERIKDNWKIKCVVPKQQTTNRKYKRLCTEQQNKIAQQPKPDYISDKRDINVFYC